MLYAHQSVRPTVGGVLVLLKKTHIVFVLTFRKTPTKRWLAVSYMICGSLQAKWPLPHSVSALALDLMAPARVYRATCRLMASAYEAGPIAPVVSGGARSFSSTPCQLGPATGAATWAGGLALGLSRAAWMARSAVMRVYSARLPTL